MQCGRAFVALCVLATCLMGSCGNVCAHVDGGAAFAQELIMMDGELLETGRKDMDCNVFRALCERSGRLCIMEAESWVTFGSFKKKLLEAGVENAIYMDMGRGWNHSWLRTDTGVVELHPKEHDYCTNWITFYK